MNIVKAPCVVTLLVFCLPVLAPADVVDWSESFLLQSSGALDNPLVRVGFNPQPEPPGHDSILDLLEPANPFIRVPDAGVSGGNMRILFGIQAPFQIDAGGQPDGGVYSFQLDGGSVETRYTVNFEMRSESGGIPIPGSWVGFNPQPEPPGLGAGPDAIGFDFRFDKTSPAWLSMVILDSNSNPLSFSSVPEPSGGFFLVAACLAMYRRRRC